VNLKCELCFQKFLLGIRQAQVRKHVSASFDTRASPAAATLDSGFHVTFPFLRNLARLPATVAGSSSTLSGVSQHPSWISFEMHAKRISHRQNARYKWRATYSPGAMQQSPERQPLRTPSMAWPQDPVCPPEPYTARIQCHAGFPWERPGRRQAMYRPSGPVSCRLAIYMSIHMSIYADKPLRTGFLHWMIISSPDNMTFLMNLLAFSTIAPRVSRA